jgi:GTPase SAR1 family protein
MTFKVIITRPNVEDDENAYHFFLNPNKGQTKRLKYVAPEDKLKATFTFEGNPIKVGDKFLACLVAVDEGVEIENATFKIQKNSPQNKPEVVNF